jgi:hypothetical protein
MGPKMSDRQKRILGRYGDTFTHQILKLNGTYERDPLADILERGMLRGEVLDTDLKAFRDFPKVPGPDEFGMALSFKYKGPEVDIISAAIVANPSGYLNKPWKVVEDTTSSQSCAGCLCRASGPWV